MKRRAYLLDTSILLNNFERVISLAKERKSKLFISDITIEELNKLKANSSLGYKARELLRMFNSSTEVKKREQGNDVIHKVSLQKENYFKRFNLNIISRTKYKRDIRSIDAKLINIAKDYNLTIITNDIKLKMLSLSN